MRTKVATATLTMLALGADRRLRGWLRRLRRRRLRPPARSRSGCRTTPRRSPGASRWSRRGTPSTPTRRSPPRRSRPARPPRRSSAPRSPPATRPAWCSTPRPRPCRSSRSRAGWSRSTSFDGGADYVEARSGDVGRAVQVAGRAVLPDPVEVEPGDDLLQQGHHEEGRHRPGEPAAGDVRRVPRRPAARSSTAVPPRRPSGRPRPASSSSPGSTSTRCTPPRPVASSWSRTARRPSTPTQGKAVADFWATMYAEGLSPRRRPTTATPSPTGKAAMAIVGPWAIAVYGETVELGRRPGPDVGRHQPGGDLHVLRRQEHRRSTRPARTRRPPARC